jgi:BirA family biotin operon repressor/biotin-[acetyl-CoA-carboxylase] ligase
MSVLLRPALPVEELHLCTVAVALAAQDACASAGGLEPELKWPNDLMVRERKLAGVLAEAVAGAPPGPRVAAVVVGLGLNVQWPPPDSPAFHPPGDPDSGHPNSGDPDSRDPVEIARSATSIWHETGSRFDPDVLLNSVLVELGPRLGALDDVKGRRRLSEEYRRRCTTLGRRVRVSTATDTVTGVATGLTDQGHLVVDAGGASRTIAAGDVVHLRDAT